MFCQLTDLIPLLTPIMHTLTATKNLMTNSMKKSELWQRLRAARSFGDKTQMEVSKGLGVSRPTVSLWESRDPAIRTNPSAQQVMGYATVCGVPAQFLVDDAADPDDVYKYGGKFGSKNDAVAPLSTEEAERRRAKAFWSAVEFKCVSDTPSLIGAFEVAIPSNSIKLRAGFLHIKNVAVFTAPVGREESDVLESATACLLLYERALGRTMNKHLMVYTRSGTFNIDDSAAYERQFGITLSAFNDVDRAAAHLSTL